jgi:hypothetical protein
VTILRSVNLVFVLAVLAQFVVQQVSNTLKFFKPADTNIFITVAAKKIARAEKNARLFSGILSNDPKLFIFFS